MKLVWAGPWNRRSAIATMGSEVVHELVSRGHEVEVLRTEAGPDLDLPPLPAPGEVAAVAEREIGQLAYQADGMIVNIGDHYGFHGGAIPLLLHAAPLLILHDAEMGGFAHGWRQAAGGEAWRVDRLAGHEGAVAPYCALASGVVVHSAHYRAVADASCAGPVATIPLCWPPLEPPPRHAGGRLVITTVGQVNRNKRADEVIRAIGASARLRERVLYVLAGQVEDAERERLLTLARRVGAPAPVFLGWVPDEVLRMVMSGTDVVSCLRYPALEGGSASLILAMFSGHPTLVSDHASYAEVPDGLVLKCPPGHEAAAVLRHLETILDDLAAARAMGEQSRAYALAQHAPAAYVDRLLPALEAATLAQPAVRTSIAIGRRLSELGIIAGDPAAGRLGDVLAAMLAEPPAQGRAERVGSNQ